MFAQPIANLPIRSVPVESSHITISPSFWDRLSTWASENKAIVYTAGAVAIVVTGAGVFYYLSESQKPAPSTQQESAVSPEKKPSKKDRRKAKKQATDTRKDEKFDTRKDEKFDTGKDEKVIVDQESRQLWCLLRKNGANIVPAAIQPKAPSVRDEDEAPFVDETTVQQLSAQVCCVSFVHTSLTDPKERKEYAAKLKAAGNKAYGSKDYNKAIDLYGRAILCKPDPIFYSNRAACYNALGEWERVVEDTTAALALESEYVKALNRRANAYDRLGKYSEALLDYTASCIIYGFSTEQSAQSVERLLKKVAESKGKEMLAKREKKLPSPTFVANYLQSFRIRPPPKGLEESAELEEGTGPSQLRTGLLAVARKTAGGYDEAAKAFEKAIELDKLGEHEAFAYNMRGTFKYLMGDNKDALSDLSKSIELQPSLTQSYIKRASMHLELGKMSCSV